MSTVVLQPWGKSNWTDYVDYWRDDDAEYIQQRTVLRYQTDASRDADNPAPLSGQVVYNETIDMLQLRSKDGTWKRYTPLPFNMTTTDTATNVGMRHTSATGGILFTAPTYTPASQANVLLAQVPIHAVNSAVILDSTGVVVKVGAKSVLLNTNATSLVSDSPISAPAVAGGTLTATSLNVAGPATVTGALSVGGNAAITGTITAAIGSSIAGVTFNDATGGYVNAAKGVQSVGGLFYGVASAGRLSAGTAAAPGASYAEVSSTDVVLHATNINLDGQPFIVAKGINYRPTLGGTNYPISPALYSASDPGVGNFPDGTIWVS